MDEVTASTSAPGRSRLSAGRVIAIVAGLIALYLIASRLGGYVPQFAAWVDGLGFWGPVVFIVGYAAAAVAFLPGSVLTLAAGAIFGLTGVIYVFAAAVLGSSLAFLVSRYVARHAVERRMSRDKRFAAIDRAVGEQGFKIVFLLRLTPLVPFKLLNYALGLTRVSLRDYVLASAGMIPGTVLYVYYGTAIGSVAQLASGTPAAGGPGRTALLAIGLVATIAVTILVTRVARGALAKATAEPGAPGGPQPGGGAPAAGGGAPAPGGAP